MFVGALIPRWCLGGGLGTCVFVVGATGPELFDLDCRWPESERVLNLKKSKTTGLFLDFNNFVNPFTPLKPVTPSDCPPTAMIKSPGDGPDGPWSVWEDLSGLVSSIQKPAIVSTTDKPRGPDLHVTEYWYPLSLVGMAGSKYLIEVIALLRSCVGVE